MERTGELAPRRAPQKVKNPAFDKLVWTKATCSPGSREGSKVYAQLLVRAEYRGKVMELDMVDACLKSYNWQAFKSKVKAMIRVPLHHYEI